MSFQVGDMLRSKTNGHICVVTRIIEGSKRIASYDVHWITTENEISSDDLELFLDDSYSGIYLCYSKRSIHMYFEKL